MATPVLNHTVRLMDRQSPDLKRSGKILCFPVPVMRGLNSQIQCPPLKWAPSDSILHGDTTIMTEPCQQLRLLPIKV
jgi:hypothetical protein